METFEYVVKLFFFCVGVGLFTFVANLIKTK